MSSFPPWLHYAVIAGTDDITFYPLPSTLADVIPAICVAVDCAKAVIKTPSGIEALKSSFDKDDRAGVSGGTIPTALDALHVYVFHAPLEDADAFHVPPRALGDTGIHSMNVFIRQSLINKFPRGTTVSEWSLSERQCVVLVSWMIIHEIARATGAFLSSCGVVAHNDTPVSAAAFPFQKGRALNKDYVVQRGKGLWGERGWWVEYQLGGCVLVDERPHQELIIYRPDSETRHPFTEQMVDQYLRGRHDPSEYDNLLPFRLDIKDAQKYVPTGRHIRGRWAQSPVGIPDQGPFKF